MKLNSTYVEGLKPYINPKTKRIHSFFHQTITATGRISSTEPNLQNIPTRMELGKRLRKVFVQDEGKGVDFISASNMKWADVLTRAKKEELIPCPEYRNEV